MGSVEPADEDGPSWQLIEKVDNFRPHIVDGYNESFKCAICLECMCEPVSVHPCGHMFDAECIKQHRASRGRQATCPKGCPDVIKAVIPAPDMKQVIRETVKVKCPNTECKKRMVADAMTAHLEACPHSRYRCTREDDDGNECDVTVVRKGMARHEKECEMVRVACPNAGCTERPGRGRLEYHMEEMCDYRVVECNWCDKSFLGKDIDEHDEACPEHEVPCPVCIYSDVPRKELDAHLADRKSLGRHLEVLRKSISDRSEEIQDLCSRATLNINLENSRIQDPDTVGISGTFEMSWAVDVAKARSKGNNTALLSPTFEFGGFLLYLAFKINPSGENIWNIYLGCAQRAHDLGSARRVTEVRAFYTLFTKDWSLTKHCDGNLWPDTLLGGRGPPLTPGQKVVVVGIRMRQLLVKHEFQTDDKEAFMVVSG